MRFEVHGLDPPDHLFHPLTEFRWAAQTIRNGLEAERAGYDAFVIGHFQEPGLLETRGSLNIPVVALDESALLAACSMGRRIGLVTIDPVFIDWHQRQVAAHGLQERLAGVRASRSICRASCTPSPIPRPMPGCARISSSGLPITLFNHERPFTIDGALVLNGIAVVEGSGNGAGAAPGDRFRRQPARHLCQGIGRLRGGISLGPVVIEGVLPAHGRYGQLPS